MTAARRLAEIRKLASEVLNCGQCMAQQSLHAFDVVERIHKLTAPKPASPKGRRKR